VYDVGDFECPVYEANTINIFMKNDYTVISLFTAHLN